MRKKLFPILSALAAAILYAVSIPLSKVLLRTTEPVYLAGFLYLGAGLGMLPLSRVTRRERAARLDRSDLPYTLGMIVLDIAAPILLLLGLRSAPAAAVSLIGNFEIVATALIALLLFHERISPLMWLSVLCLTAACLLLSLGGTERLSFSPASLLVLAACACWGLENNCTRKLSGKDAYEIVILKGIFPASAPAQRHSRSGNAFRLPARSARRSFSAFSLTASAYSSMYGRSAISARLARARIIR